MTHVYHLTDEHTRTLFGSHWALAFEFNYRPGPRGNLLIFDDEVRELVDTAFADLGIAYQRHEIENEEIVV